MTIDLGAAMARNVFHHGQYTAIQHARDVTPCQCQNDFAICCIGPVTDDVVGPGLWHIEDRQTIHVDANFGKVISHQTGRIARRPQGMDSALAVQFAE